MTALELKALYDDMGMADDPKRRRLLSPALVLKPYIDDAGEHGEHMRAIHDITGRFLEQVRAVWQLDQ